MIPPFLTPNSLQFGRGKIILSNFLPKTNEATAFQIQNENFTEGFYKSTFFIAPPTDSMQK